MLVQVGPELWVESSQVEAVTQEDEQAAIWLKSEAVIIRTPWPAQRVVNDLNAARNVYPGSSATAVEKASLPQSPLGSVAEYHAGKRAAKKKFPKMPPE